MIVVDPYGKGGGGGGADKKLRPYFSSSEAHITESSVPFHFQKELVGQCVS